MSQENVQKVAIPTPVFNEIAQYLEDRVYKEVAGLLSAVQQTMEIIEPVQPKTRKRTKKKKTA